MQNRKRFTGACRGFSNRCGAKNSAREKYLSATPKFLSATSKAFRLVWLILLLFGFFIVAPTVGEKGVALIVGETLSLKLPLCTRLDIYKICHISTYHPPPFFQENWSLFLLALQVRDVEPEPHHPLRPAPGSLLSRTGTRPQGQHTFGKWRTWNFKWSSKF